VRCISSGSNGYKEDSRNRQARCCHVANLENDEASLEF
jgi:hypothetical protein